MLALLQSKPGMSETGISEDGAWARFADGTVLVVCNNLDATPNPSRQTLQRTVSGHSTTTASRAGGLPDSPNIVLGTSLGSWYEDYLKKVEVPFETQNYTRVQPDSSVDALKALDNVAVLHLFGHAGLFDIRKPGPKVLAVWTSTLRAADGSTDVKYKDDLKDGSLIYFTSAAYQVNATTSVKKVWETHYAFTSKFVTKYWTGKFNKNSVVFINGCNTASLDAIDFEFACLNAGASFYVGWNNRMKLGEAVDSATYLFDRLLGSNSALSGGVSAETPPQRAFGITSILAEMHTHQRGTAAYALDTTLPPPEKRGGASTFAMLSFLTTNLEFQQLAPSIENLEVNERADELAINGVFGSGQGDVLVGRTGLSVKSWTANRIVCQLPRTGPGSSGDVSVTSSAPRLLSNTVQLTEWIGTAMATATGDGTLKMVMNFNLHFRGDVLSHRIQPHGDPVTFATNYQHSLTSTGTYEFSGKYDSPDGTSHEDWSGSGALPAYVPQTAGSPVTSSLDYEGSFDQNRQWSLNILATAIQGNHVHTITRDPAGKVTSDKTVVTDGVWQSVGDLNGGLWLKTLPLNYNIPAGSIMETINPTHTLTLEWSAMNAISPPDPTVSRSSTLASPAGRRR
ncbi:MAG: hypothetical protein JWL77_6168 [Chthonomonadaceae bacterium]|nr:hypothetical protein [Chthonomonadaceae bacterium]